MLENNKWGLPKTLILTDVRNYDPEIVNELTYKGFVIATKGIRLALPFVKEVKSDNGWVLHGRFPAIYEPWVAICDVKRKYKGLKFQRMEADEGKTLFLYNIGSSLRTNKFMNTTQFHEEVLLGKFPHFICIPRITYFGGYLPSSWFSSALRQLGYVVVASNQLLTFAKGTKYV